MRPVWRNPFGLGLGEMVLLGVGIWFVTSDVWKSLIHLIAPSGASPGTSTPVGAARGRDPNQPGNVLIPSSPSWRIISFDRPWLHFSGEESWTVTVSHTGPAGAYVVGVDAAYFSPFCAAGAHGDLNSNAEVDLSVNDDANWAFYTVTLRVNAGGFGINDFRVYIRDQNGTQHLDHWFCAEKVGGN